MLQMVNNRGRKYAYGRDIINQFFPIAAKAMHRLSTRSWSTVVKDYAQLHNLGDEDFVRGALALREFHDQVLKDPSRSMADLWFNAGLDRLPKPVLLCLFFELGVGFASSFYTCAQAAYPQNAAPPMNDELGGLVEKAAHAAKADLPSQRARRAADVASDARRALIKDDSQLDS